MPKFRLTEATYAIVLLLILWAIFFSPIIIGRYVYYLDDLKILYYPIEYAYAHFQSMFSLPEWSQVFGFGQPLLAWGQLGFFTPIHVLLRALQIAPLPLLQISVVSYFLIGLLGMHTFLVKRHFTPIAAALGASLFTFSGFAIGHLNHVNFYTGTMVLPWLLVSILALVQVPSWKKGAVTSCIAAVMALSAQPQVVLYSLMIAALLGVCLAIETIGQKRQVNTSTGSYSKKLIIITLGSAILWACVSSLAILPLQEFLPSTERAGALPQEELLDFSYPPYHAVTLVLPYFFGDHDSYWGPKGFQELAAYVGLIPLFLACAAIGTSFRRHRVEKISGILLVMVGILIALGRYSALYYWLVENHIVTSLANPGRFVFLFDVGIALLATTGLQELFRWKETTRTSRLAFTLSGLAGIAICATPFLIQISSDARIYKQLASIFIDWQPQAIIATASAAILVISFILLSKNKSAQAVPYLLTIASAAALLGYGWNYNPRTLTANVKNNTAFINNLHEYATTNNLPPRLYARPELLRDAEKLTFSRSDEIGPLFSVYQPIRATEANLSCLKLRLTRDNDPGSGITVTISPTMDGNPIRTSFVQAEDVLSSNDTNICFDPIKDSQNTTLWVSLTSPAQSGLYVVYQSAAVGTENVYFIRKQKPTPDQIVASQKPARLVYEPIFESRPDLETALLERHINVTTDTSSARWIGALSIRWYRDFIEEFLANDVDNPIDGDGIHAIVRERRLVNLAGITHLAQALPIESEDTMDENNFPLVAKTSAGAYEARLYSNPEAFPKAFVAPVAAWRDADDETRFAMMQPGFNPATTVYVSGETPPTMLPNNVTQGSGEAHITTYDPTRVDLSVTASQDSVVVLTDSWTPQWLAYVDDKPTLSLKADSVFRAVIIPKGTHTVSFRYYSPATHLAKILTLAGLVVVAITWLPLQRVSSRLSSSLAKSDPTR